MASTREIRRRIRSVKSIGQITRAMELVAAAKMRKAQETALAGRKYNQTMYAMLAELLYKADLEDHPLLMQSPSNTEAKDDRPLVIVFGPDKGLSGALPANLIKEVSRFIAQNPNTKLITMGKRSRDGLIKQKATILADFPLNERPRLKDILPIAKMAVDEFRQGRATRVLVANTRFVSTMQQTPQVHALLPLSPQMLQVDFLRQDEGDSDNQVDHADFLFEPGVDEILEQLLPRFIEMTIYQDLLEALASQYSAQMMAMRNASDNAKELQDELTLTYNQLRQASITAELAEIAAGAGA